MQRSSSNRAQCQLSTVRSSTSSRSSPPWHHATAWPATRRRLILSQATDTDSQAARIDTPLSSPRGLLASVEADKSRTKYLQTDSYNIDCFVMWHSDAALSSDRTVTVLPPAEHYRHLSTVSYSPQSVEPVCHYNNNNNNNNNNNYNYNKLSH